MRRIVISAAAALALLIAGGGRSPQASAERVGSIDDEAIEGNDLDAGAIAAELRLGRDLDQLHAFLEGKQRRLAGMDADCRVDGIGHGKRSLQHIKMAVGQRVEGAGVKGGAFNHGRLLASLSNKGKSD